MAIQTLDSYLKKKKNNDLLTNQQQSSISTLEDYSKRHNFSIGDLTNQSNTNNTFKVSLESLGSINSDGYADLGKTWGDYYYHDYAKNGKYKLYAKNEEDGNIGFYYYDEADKSYKTFGNQTWMTTEESDKKDLEEAKSLGYVGDGKEIDIIKKLLTVNEPEEKHAPIIDLVKSSEAFDDGYQFGDVTKTIGASVGDLAVNVGKGFLSTTEGVTDAVEYTLADFLNAFGLENAANSIKEHAKTNATGAIFGTNENTNDNLFKKGWSEDLDKNSVLGSLSDSVGQGIGNIGAMAGLNYLTGGSTLSSFTSSFSSAYGNARSEAYENGADDKNARIYGTINGLAEAISEQFFDSIPGSKTAGWGEKLVGKVSGGVEKYFGSKTGKIVSKILSNSGEGFEEIISSILSTTGNDIMYNLDSDYIYNKENVTGNVLNDIGDAAKTEWLQSFLSASLTSAIVNAGNTFVSEQQKNQILKTYAQENNLTLEETKAMFEKNVNDQISVQENLPYMEKQKQEELTKYKTLEEMKSGKLTNQDRNTKITNMLESANKFNFKSSEETKSMLDTVSKVIKDKNYNILFDDTITNNQGNSVNAQIKTLENGEVEIRLNPNSPRAAEFLLCHEITHAIETDSMKQLIIDYASKNSEFNQSLESLKQTYGTDDVSSEVIADISGQLLGNQEFINNLSMKEPSIFKKIYNKIISLANKITGNSKESLFIKDLKNKWETAYRTQNNNLNSETKYMMTSIKGMENGIRKNNRYQDIKNRYNQALKMEQIGIYTNEEIRQQTGWFKDNKNNWEFEISDYNTRLKLTPKNNAKYKLSDMLEANTLYEMYPDLKDVKVVLKDMNSLGRFSGKKIEVNNKLINKIDDLRGTLLHEIQHYIQEVEGLPTGTTILFGNERYANRKGEIEAADTKNRRNLNVEERKNVIPESSKTNPTHPNRQSILNHKRNFKERIIEKIYDKFENQFKKINKIHDVVDNTIDKLYNKYGDDVYENIENYETEIIDYIEKNTQLSIKDNEVDLQKNRTEDSNGLGIGREHDVKKGLDNSSFSLKQKQLEIIQNTNPAEDIYHTWVRSIDDIKTFEETLNDSDYKEYFEAGEDFDETYTAEMAKEALETGKITVYSSYPIEQGIFVSPSKIEAESYAGNGIVYSKEVNINDVAWIDPTQGQYAQTDTKYSQQNDNWQEYLEQNYKSEGTRTYFEDIKNKLEDINLPTSTEVNLPSIETIVEENQDIDNYDSVKAAENIIGDKKSFLSNEAEKLYNEIQNLKKGIKASQKLGEILDLGYDWQEIKTALANIKWKPEQLVNNNSKSEQTIRNILSNDYLKQLRDLSYSELGIKDKTKLTPEDTVKIKRSNYIKEVDNLKKNLEAITNEIDDKIKKKQQEYNSKKNKDTKVAQKIFRQINELKTRQDNIAVDYNRRIENLTEKIKNFDVKYESRKIKRAQYKEQLRNEITPLLEDASDWKDKKFLGGFRYGRETAQRNMIDIAGKETGNKINETIFDPITKHESDKTRRINEKFKIINDLNLDLKKKYTYAESVSPDAKVKKIKIGEDELVRLYIEKKISDFELEDIGADVSKIKNASTTITKMLDEIYQDINEVFDTMGLPSVEYRKDYFPHSTKDTNDSFITKLASVVGIDLSNQELPTTIAGKTDTFKPNKAWNGHLLQRTKDQTNFNAIGSLERYIVGIEDIIAHTEDIQKVRTLSQEVRNQFTDDYIKEQIEQLRANDTLSEEQRDRLIDDLYKRDNNQLSGLVSWLDEYANVLANKKSFADRDMERNIGRNAYTSMSNIEGIIASNTIGANASVSLTNFAPLAQALATTKGRYLVKASMDVLSNDIKTLTGNKDVSFVDASDFLTNRFGTDSIGRQSFTDKIKNIAFKPMEIVDNFTSEVIVRAKFYENLDKGMSEDVALSKADKDAGKIMADRSKGALPTIFNQKNPFNKLITMFQVEPNNIISNYTKDMSTDASSKGQLAYQYTKLAIGSYIFNSIMMNIRGGNEVLPDPIRFIQYLIQSLTGDDDERDKAKSDMLEALTGSLPFVSNIAGLFGIEAVGRIPVSSGIPDITNLPNLFSDDVSDEYKLQTFRDEVLKPLSYWLMPTGAAQTWKTIQGIEAVNEGGSYKYAKDGSQKMQFPVEDASATDYIKAGLFGKYSLDNAKDYVDSGFKSLSEKETEIYKSVNLPYNEFLEIKDGISEAKSFAKANGESQTEAVYDYIYNLPLTDEQKNIMLNGTLNKSDEKKDDNGYIKYVDSKNRSYWYDEENDILYNRNYHEISTSKLSELTKYSNEVDMSSYGDYESLEEFNYATKNPDKYNAIMQVTDYSTFLDYQDDIEDISDKYSDMISNATNSKQKSLLSTKKKQEIQKYINSLNLNKYQKMMLEKLAGGYSIKNYKSVLQNYINDLDITKEEKESIDAALFG